MESSPSSSPLELTFRSKQFGGEQRKYRHRSSALHCDMTVAVYLPPGASAESTPVLIYLSGLTCTEENFVTKAGHQRFAAEHGIAIVSPDTSPRNYPPVEGEESSWDFGRGAGFYVNATVAPWSEHYQMYSYVNEELHSLLAHLPVNASRCSIFGHSMGGHGALISYLRNPGKYLSVSAFAPITHPIETPMAKKAFASYLGEGNIEEWNKYDATVLLSTFTGDKSNTILIDQGSADTFREQLQSEQFADHARSAGFAVDLRLRDGYDHSYYYISTFIHEHIAFHARALLLKN